MSALARLGRATFALALALGGCTLTYQPSDYFDPAAQLVTIATVAGSDEARMLALGANTVFFTTSTGVYAVPKSGGTPTLLRRASATDVADLAGDGGAVVAWCGTMGVERWTPSGIVVVDANATSCTSLAVTSDRIAAVVGTGPDAYEVRTYLGPSFAPSTPTYALPLPKNDNGRAYIENHRVALSGSDAYYLSWATYYRALRATDPPLPKAENACALGTLAVVVANHFVVARTGATTLGFAQSPSGVLVYGDDVCCNVLNGVCPTPKLLPGSGGVRAIAVRDRYLYRISDAELVRVDLGVLAAGQSGGETTIRDHLDGVAGSLAIDGTWAFFGQGQRIQRAALPR
jgi:hypothetical protein